MPSKNQTFLIVASLFCTYFFWGSTYLAIKFAIESFPTFLMVGLRFTIAGALLYVALRFFGAPNPSRIEWRNSAMIGFLLPVLGNGTVTHVQQTVSSSVAALAIATAPIWMAIFSSFVGEKNKRHKITNQEWLGVAIGFLGIMLLNVRGSLQGDWLSASLLMFAAASWSFGSVWSKHLHLPKGLMGAASQMLCGGLIALIISFFAGETWPTKISTKAWGAMVFMIFLGSIVTYSAFQWLLKNVRPLVASSNTFVNPIVAFVMGVMFASETIHATEYLALAVILVGVFLVLSATNKDNI